MSIQGAPILSVRSDTRATLSLVVHVDICPRALPTLTLWAPLDATYQSWLPYWRADRQEP